MQNIFKLRRKFVLLAIMLFGLSFVMFTDVGSNSVGAAPCCTECMAEEEYCWMLAQCADRRDCLAINNAICYSWCSPYC